MKSVVRLIILNHTRFGENSIVVHTLSSEYGRRSFLVRIGSKTGMSLFLPLNIVEATVVSNPKSDLWTAHGFSSCYPLAGIRGSVAKNAITMFVSEVLYRVVKDGAAEEGLFDWCCSQILTLDALESDYSNFHICFLLEFAAALGFRPTGEDIAPFCGEHFPDIQKFISLPFSEALLLPLTGAARTEICEDIIRYLEHHTDSAIRVRSLAVLRELF